MSARARLLEKIKDKVLTGKDLPLYEERIKNKVFPVIGEGNPFAKIVLVGEAPGKKEAETGRPFCGAAGKILEKLLDSAGIERNDVYITNIVKDRPPRNRDPYPKEIAAYAPFLDGQINIIRPKALATLGRFSTAYIMNKFGLSLELKPISHIRGRVFEAKADFGTIKIVPLYHPAFAIYNNSSFSTLEKDFKMLAKFK